MRRVLWGLAVLLPAGFAIAATGSASAADLSLPPPASSPVYSPAPITNWSGLYLGVNGGFGWGSANAEFGSGASGATDLKPSGWVGGAQVGYNWQFQSGWLLGVEADIAASGLSDDNTGDGAGPPGPVTIEQKIGSIGTVRGRLGYATGRWLPYVTGGLAFAHGTRTEDFGGNTYSDSNSHTGWTIGAGVEYALTNNWSLRGEYRYHDFGTKNYAIPSPGGQGTDVHLTASTATIGLNYKF
jgi:outer membrane immunogenic protein